MVLINHKDISDDSIESIEKIEDIKKTNPNSCLRFDFSEKNLELIRYCQANDLAFALNIESIKEVILSNSFDAKYIITNDRELVIKAQKIADNYMFDLKVLFESDNEDDIEYLALNEIDGVVF